jgi:hypothetical protein
MTNGYTSSVRSSNALSGRQVLCSVNPAAALCTPSFILHSRTMNSGFTHTVTEMSNRIFMEAKAWSACKAGKLRVICELTDTWHIKTL